MEEEARMHSWRLVDFSQRRYRSSDPADFSLFYEKSDADSEDEGYRCALIKVPVIFPRKLARIRGSASSPCECLTQFRCETHKLFVLQSGVQ